VTPRSEVEAEALRVAADLYALPPEDFVAARDQLAARLKNEGDTDTAAAVKRLRRPSVVAWAVNVAARERPDGVQALLEAGEDLRREQRRMLSGGGTDGLRRATEVRRSAVGALADVAVHALDDRGGGADTHRDQIAQTLEAASLDEELGGRLRSGTLEREARPDAGFGAIEGFQVLTGGAEEQVESEAEGSRADDVAAGRRARSTPKQRADAEEKARARAGEAKEAERRATAAERTAERAERRGGELRRRAEEAESAAREAEVEARRLRDEARTERRRADRAAKAAEDAKARTER
jgi:hypothetical protein